MSMLNTVQPDAPPDDGPERCDMTADGAGGTDPHQNEQAAPVGNLDLPRGQGKHQEAAAPVAGAGHGVERARW